MGPNSQQAVRTIIFNTNSNLPKNAGVLLAWTLLSCCTIAVFSFLLRRAQVQIEQPFFGVSMSLGDLVGKRDQKEHKLDKKMKKGKGKGKVRNGDTTSQGSVVDVDEAKDIEKEKDCADIEMGGIDSTDILALRS